MDVRRPARSGSATPQELSEKKRKGHSFRTSAKYCQTHGPTTNRYNFLTKHLGPPSRVDEVFHGSPKEGGSGGVSAEPHLGVGHQNSFASKGGTAFPLLAGLPGSLSEKWTPSLGMDRRPT